MLRDGVARQHPVEERTFYPAVVVWELRCPWHGVDLRSYWGIMEFLLE